MHKKSTRILRPNCDLTYAEQSNSISRISLALVFSVDTLNKNRYPYDSFLRENYLCAIFQLVEHKRSSYRSQIWLTIILIKLLRAA